MVPQFTQFEVRRVSAEIL